MPSQHQALSGLDPLRDLLGDVMSRLEALEAQVGVTPPAGARRGGALARGNSLRRTTVVEDPAPSKAKLAGEYDGWMDGWMRVTVVVARECE
jgi:hypothetical protein